MSEKNYRCRVNYNVSAAEVYHALTEEEGLKNWWTTDCSVPPTKVGAELTFRFTFRFGPTFNVMRVKQLIPNKKVVWECTQHHHIDPTLTKTDEWVGTELTFELSPTNNGKTELKFTHKGLTPALECYSLCEKGWGFFLTESLKAYLETGSGKPYDQTRAITQ